MINNIELQYIYSSIIALGMYYLTNNTVICFIWTGVKVTYYRHECYIILDFERSCVLYNVCIIKPQTTLEKGIGLQR